MGKIILEFDSVEEQEDARLAIDGYKWKLAMYDLDQELRSTVKYAAPLFGSEGEATSAEVEAADKLREKIREVLNSHGLDLNA